MEIDEKRMFESNMINACMMGHFQVIYKYLECNDFLY